MNDDNDIKMLNNLGPHNSNNNNRPERLEGMVWQRLEDRHASRRRLGRGLLILGLVGGVSAGVVYGASAVYEAPWADHIIDHVQAHLCKLCELIFGNH